MNIMEFNETYVLVKDRVRASGGVGVEAAQEELKRLLPSIADEHDRQVAQTLIDALPSRTKPAAPPSERYLAAVRVLEAADRPDGSLSERVAAIEEAHRTIWAMAEAVPEPDSSRIRALTRTLEHLRNSLANSPFDRPDFQSGTD